ncbi:glycogen debranching protein GlgX [Aureimonas jatrophae]|uniref:Glycogen operon protein n=1 Tax=Aureimonas jatrophae TaxID=1166073 RepID=A0A1H0DN74_9HYPH|nr:glycogen debranching protein GlgX [Aureimonas jatrophae]MBB3951988.1 glycogen operon protein [Aureimonas jatrophae]SDN71602.1 glycogen operon protein [Aureimonas jatrophae]
MQTITAEHGCPARLGASPTPAGVHFAVTSADATRIDLCLFEPGSARETARLPLPGRRGDTWFGFVPGIGVGALYGFRADGAYDPARALRFDAAKLLVDPYALALDRPFVYHPALAAPASERLDTAALVPCAVVADPPRDAGRLVPGRPGLTYELNVRGYTQRHPGVPEHLRGTLGALAEPAVLDHIAGLGVETVELMPIAAFLDERHLVRLGLTNAWGYNPICHMAPDPRLVPGGWAEVRRVTEGFHARGIRVLLDVVLNHSGESDRIGPTVSCRGLDNRAYYRHEPDGELVNVTGTGNTIALDREPGLRLAVETLRTWGECGGIDGFRYDLAPVLGRTDEGFRADAPLLRAIASDSVLATMIHVAEPWDIGLGGYQVGRFPEPFLEWGDGFRDDVRRFWRGDRGTLSGLATRLAGSPDRFDPAARQASDCVNFVCAHDGFSLLDLVSYADKHNWANGEENRDGHGDNHSWNNGVEGASEDPGIRAARARDVRALLATLFLARGTPMLVAGDEFGRTQGGNNNAYAQDNPTTWLDWSGADLDLARFTAELAALRAREPALHLDRFLVGTDLCGEPDVAWLAPDGSPMVAPEWTSRGEPWLGLRLAGGEEGRAVLAYLNAAQASVTVTPPPGRWRLLLRSDAPGETLGTAPLTLPPRAVVIFGAEA